MGDAGASARAADQDCCLVVKEVWDRLVGDVADDGVLILADTLADDKGTVALKATYNTSDEVLASPLSRLLQLGHKLVSLDLGGINNSRVTGDLAVPELTTESPDLRAELVEVGGWFLDGSFGQDTTDARETLDQGGTESGSNHCVYICLRVCADTIRINIG